LAGSRKNNPFIALNCAALPETLLDSELFGHEKGAFTGAIRTTKGLFTQAHGGSLFLDEIGDMPLSLQAKLLRVLQERQFYPVGSERPVEVDVRVVVATQKDLEEAVKQGGFREDLFYRIHVIPIRLPSLRERKEDIPLLVRHFIEKFSRINQKAVQGIAPEALDMLVAREWPGNIRELENVIERGVILTAAEQLQAADLFPADQPAAFIFDIQEDIFQAPFKDAKERLIADFHTEYIKRVLARVGGNVSLAAKECGLKRPYLHRLMKESDIKAKAYRQPE
jgi:two-component system response regulator GlrR